MTPTQKRRADRHARIAALIAAKKAEMAKAEAEAKAGKS
jgi:hypothetical protein